VTKALGWGVVFWVAPVAWANGGDLTRPQEASGVRTLAGLTDRVPADRRVRSAAKRERPRVGSNAQHALREESGWLDEKWRQAGSRWLKTILPRDHRRVEMSASVLYMSMSLDGYIADPNDRLGGDDGNRLHEWIALPTGSSASALRQPHFPV
jgi:hypothetical protein